MRVIITSLHCRLTAEAIAFAFCSNAFPTLLPHVDVDVDADVDIEADIDADVDVDNVTSTSTLTST